MEIYGVDPKDSGRRVSEAIEAILQIWTSEPPYAFDGEFWKFQLSEHLDSEMGLGTLHKPLQKPYPPVMVPCITRDSKGVMKAAVKGFFPISHHMVSTGALDNHWSTYSAGAEASGRQISRRNWRISRNVYLAQTTGEARDTARSNSLGQCIEYILELSRRGPGLEIWKRDANMTDAECNLDYFMDEVIVAGDPDEVTRQLIALRDLLGDFGTLVLVAHDWDDKQRWLESLELFARAKSSQP